MGAKCFIFCDVNCVITLWFGLSRTVSNFRALFICLSRFLGNAGNSTKFSRLIFNRLSFNKQIKLLYKVLPVWFVFFYCGFCQWVFKGQLNNFRGKSSCKWGLFQETKRCLPKTLRWMQTSVRLYYQWVGHFLSQIKIFSVSTVLYWWQLNKKQSNNQLTQSYWYVFSVVRSISIVHTIVYALLFTTLKHLKRENV